MAEQERLTIHVPPDASPTALIDMGKLLVQFQDRPFTSSELLTVLTEHGRKSRPEIPPTARALGLLEQCGKSMRLSEIGKTIARLRDDVAGELMHYLLFSSWTHDEPLKFLPSWTYRITCLRYWHLGEVRIDGDFKSRLIPEINGEAQEYFAKYGTFSDPSFGPKSLRGVAVWLEALQPPVLVGDVFRRRTFCIPELVVLALGYSVRDQADAINVDILLSRERRETIAQLCLLSPEHLDQVLDYALTSFPHLVQPGTTAGFYGRFVRLLKRPTVEDVVR